MILCLIAAGCFIAGLAAGYVLREVAAWLAVKKSRRYARVRGGIFL